MIIQHTKYETCFTCGHAHETEPQIDGCDMCTHPLGDENNEYLSIYAHYIDKHHKSSTLLIKLCSWPCLFKWLREKSYPYESVSLPVVDIIDSKVGLSLKDLLAQIKE